MALTLKFSATVVDKDANELLLKDTTGVYHVTTNPTGYGVANSFVTPGYTFIKYKVWTDTAWVQALLTSGQLTSLLASTLEVTPSDLGSSGDSFSDGVNQLEMIPLNDAAVSATFTSGSKIVTLAAGWDPDDFSGLVSFIAGITDADTHTDILEIDPTGTNNTTQLTLKEAFSGTTTSQNLWFGPYKDIKVLVNKAAEACIAQTLAANSPLNCHCTTDITKVTKMIEWRFTADILLNCEDYTGAHNTIVQLNKVCNQSLSTCAF